MFNLNSVQFARKPFGEYQLRLAKHSEDRDYFKHTQEVNNPWSALELDGKLVEGVYVNPSNNSAIVRVIVDDGEFKGSPAFTIYMSEIDMRSVIQTIMQNKGVSTINTVDALKSWNNEAVKFYHYNEQGTNREGKPALFEKWRTYRSNNATDATDISVLVAEAEEDDL